MKNAFLLASLLAIASAAALVVELMGAISFSMPALAAFAGGFCGLGVLALAIADYAPRRRSQLGRRAQRATQSATTALRPAPRAAATWGYQTISA